LILLVIGAVVLGYSIAHQRWGVLAGLLSLPLALLWPVQVALGAFALLTPFDPLVVVGQGEGGRSVTAYVGALAIMILVGTALVRQRLQRPPAAAFWWSLLIIWGGASVAWAIQPAAVAQALPTALSLLLLYVTAVSIRINRRELNWVAMLTVVGGVAAGAFACVQFYNGHFFGQSERASLIAGDRQVDPNLFAASLLLPLSLAVYHFIRSRGWFRKSLALAAGGVILLAILATMSRGAVLAVAVVFFVFLFRSRINSRWLRPVLILGLALAVVGLFSLRAESSSARGSGRLDIWIVGLTSLKKYGLIGAGLENFFFAFRDYAGYQPSFRYYSMGAHNIYLQVWVELGIVGLGVMMAAIASQLKVVQQFCAIEGELFARDILPYEAAFWGMLVTAFFLGVIWSKMFWLSLILFTVATRTLASQTSTGPSRGYKQVGEPTRRVALYEPGVLDGALR
jgi:O-antigen ligase